MVSGKSTKAKCRRYYGVKTTGIYCVPSCPARPALRKNVVYFDSVEAAERAGFRACKRCRPKGPSLLKDQALKITAACRVMERAEEIPSLDMLAKQAGMSRYYFHRIFKTVTGLTPKAYALAHRAGKVRDRLRKSQTVTEAIYGAGFNSNSRFYAKSAQMLGMKPTNFQVGGAGETIRFAVGECSLGSILVAASELGICAVFLGDDPDALVKNLQDRFFDRLVARVVGLVEAPGVGLDLPLDLRGTAFQQRVWQALREIPAGSTASYTDIAKRIGLPKAVRAVAGACGSNPVAVAIPCHRVVRNDGALSGYRWGIERKRALLKTEARIR